MKKNYPHFSWNSMDLGLKRSASLTLGITDSLALKARLALLSRRMIECALVNYVYTKYSLNRSLERENLHVVPIYALTCLYELKKDEACDSRTPGTMKIKA